MEPNEGEGVEGQSTKRGPEVCGAGRETSGQGGAGGAMEPGEAVRTMSHVEQRSQGEADWSMG